MTKAINVLAAGLIALVAFSWASQAIAQQMEVNPCVVIPATTPNVPTAGCSAVTTSNPLPVTTSPAAAGSGTAGYPFGATPISASGTGTTAATTATLAAAAGKFTYICGWTITSNATAATSGNATVGTVTGGNTLTYVQTVAAAPAAGGASQTYTPCIPGNAVNSTIVVTSAAAGAGGVTNVAAWGYQQ